MHYTTFLGGLLLTSAAIAAPTRRSNDADIANANPFNLEERAESIVSGTLSAESVVDLITTETKGLDLPVRRTNVAAELSTEELTALLDSLDLPTSGTGLKVRKALGLDTVTSTVDSTVATVEGDLPALPVRREALGLDTVTSTVDSTVATVEGDLPALPVRREALGLDTVTSTVDSTVATVEGDLPALPVRRSPLDLDSTVATVESTIEGDLPVTLPVRRETVELSPTISKVDSTVSTLEGDAPALPVRREALGLDTVTSTVDSTVATVEGEVPALPVRRQNLDSGSVTSTVESEISSLDTSLPAGLRRRLLGLDKTTTTVTNVVSNLDEVLPTTLDLANEVASQLEAAVEAESLSSLDLPTLSLNVDTIVADLEGVLGDHQDDSSKASTSSVDQALNQIDILEGALDDLKTLLTLENTAADTVSLNSDVAAVESAVTLLQSITSL